ncbi:MAG: tyrosine-type recombinase/integrase [Acetatifactor sp.]|nr:tyrosine-type recombinase/integrase [Acetatifactor sp.]
MNTLQRQIDNYLAYCRYQKRLDAKTLKAYRIDLKQFSNQFLSIHAAEITAAALEDFIGNLHQIYQPKTVKRKIASVKAFFHYLEYKELIDQNPFNKVRTKFREPFILPKTIPLHTVEDILRTVYTQYKYAKTDYQRRSALRDAAAIELLFATGMRISELCSLSVSDVNLYDRTVLIYGKGAKERHIQIGNDDVVRTLELYKKDFFMEMKACEHFFVNLAGRALTDQSVRRMINKYTDLAAIELHITPHMFRHTFATSLLEADVDIRYIQEMLGHSSINVTEIYTHVAMNKQREILVAKHPRRNFCVG